MPSVLTRKRTINHQPWLCLDECQSASPFQKKLQTMSTTIHGAIEPICTKLLKYMLMFD